MQKTTTGSMKILPTQVKSSESAKTKNVSSSSVREVFPFGRGDFYGDIYIYFRPTVSSVTRSTVPFPFKKLELLVP